MGLQHVTEDALCQILSTLIWQSVQGGKEIRHGVITGCVVGCMGSERCSSC